MFGSYSDCREVSTSLEMSRVCDGVRLRRRETGWTPGLSETNKHFTPGKVKHKNSGLKETTKENRNHHVNKDWELDIETEKLRDKDNKPTGDEGKTGTIYKGKHTGVRHDAIREAEEWLRAGEGN